VADRSAASARPLELPDIDMTVAHSSRVYDYLLGGSDNFAVDREAAHRQIEAMGSTLEQARAEIRANRAFLGRAVRYLANEVGIRQFLDLGTGIPNADNVHAVAQQAAPEARIVYVDHDPIVLAHAHALLRSTQEGATLYVDADLREPDTVLELAAGTIDLDQPVAVMLVSILHHITDAEDPPGVVAHYMSRVPSGSYLVVSHLTKDIRSEEMEGLESSPPPDAAYSFLMRSHAEVSRFFDGLELLEPGVVTVDRWRPEHEPTAGVETPPFWCGVGHKA